MDATSAPFDVLVVGGGHAGVEAAAAAARMGSVTCLVTLRRAGIGQMSCNPAIGGVGKGHLVKEVDALGGLMGQIIDRTGIQFRMLNESKGPAVRASRAQADRDLYQRCAQEMLQTQARLSIIEGEVAGIDVVGGRVRGISLSDGSVIRARSVILTSGTFLRGLMHTGSVKTEGGRCGDRAARGLSVSLEHLGFSLGRLKTGTPPRLRKSSIDFSILEEQKGDDPPRPFSLLTGRITQPQISCWLTATNEAAHDIIASNRERSPMFNGQIQSSGPRYCPSIEDKVFRFSDKASHTVFLEPEGYESELVYPNGISTSLPIDVQLAFVRKIRGLEHAEIVQAGYAVEYDFVDPRGLHPTLETKLVGGLFFAGQINGTSGYEEAAGQGIVAGINAALQVSDRDPFVVQRGSSYLGVMIDDLTTLGVEEPYRMFTSRAEYRLILREDNAALRLTPDAVRLGAVTDEHRSKFEAYAEQLDRARSWSHSCRVNPTIEVNEWLTSRGSAVLRDSILVATLVRRPELSLSSVLELTSPGFSLEPEQIVALETECKFAGYLARQEDEIAKLRKVESEVIPSDFCYDSIPSLRIEAREKLKRVQPYSIGQAMRIPGVTPSAISLVALYLKRRRGALSDSSAV